MNFKSTKVSLFIAIIVLFCCSCSSYEHVPYFQDLDQSNITREEINNYSPLNIQPGDLLAISVSSPSSGAEQFSYNLNRISGSQGDTSPQNSVIGYLVDNNGNINLPFVGQMKVSGLTTNNLTDQLQNALVKTFTKPIVNVRILNFKISVLGDVARPDIFTIQNERITLPEALSLAGDLNITAIRNNILLIREINGKREFIPIDLNSKKLFESPYYYLKNHDVIYVTPNKTKVSSNNTAGFQRASLIISALSVVALFVVYHK
ncbi:polysaccharide biosynthesis/export family protein [Mucilaginibacter sp. McL0603]|uniref:polysaccharide biosynthesis/export family protein n=1 Tax=Mucilaginibacter sp. McL0603 TaxID=3415670 RepID=UPI003CF4765B